MTTLIKNQFINELDLEFNQNRLLEILKTKKNRGDLYHFQYPYDLDPYTVAIRQQFPFLSSIFNIYKTISKLQSPIHIDAHRQAALNIPLYGTDDSLTIFYTRDNCSNMEYIPNQFSYYIKSQVTELFRFTLTRATIINTTYPHSVINGNHIRAILSWSILPEYSFEDIIQLIDNHT